MNFRLVGKLAIALACFCPVLMPSVANAAPPANDNVANAQVIGPALPIAVPASNVDATAEVGEPSLGGNSAISTIWFQWTAPAAGPVVVDLCSSGFTGDENPFQTMAVRNGAGFGALIAERSGECNLRFTAAAGLIYKIAVDYRDDQGSFTFRLRQLAPPANNNFANRTVIGPALPITVSSTSLDAGYEAGEPGLLGGSGSSRSVWYSWTAPNNGQVRLDVCEFDAIVGPANRTIAVYTGNTLGTLVLVESESTYCELSFVATGGTPYQIAFSGNIGGEGPFVLNLKNAPPPTNDNFANATLVGPGLPVAIQGTNEFSTTQVGEPSHGGISGGPYYSSWFNWTPAQNARVKIKTCGRDFGARLGVYTGATVGTLTEVGEPPPYGPYCSKVLDAVAGTTYRIAAAGGPQTGEYGTYDLDIHVLDVPSNDNIENAATLSPNLPASIEGSTIDATYTNAEPNHSPSYGNPTASVWFRWTARSDNAIIFSACSSTEPNRVAVYSEDPVDGLVQIDSAGEGCRGGLKGGRLAIAPDSGKTYMIAVAAAVRDFESDFTLSSTGPPIATPPKAQFSLKKAIQKCKKIKSKKKRASCIKKARKKAAIIKCQKIANPGKEKQCIRKAQRKFR